MASISDIKKRGRGRPSKDTEAVLVRIPQPLLESIDRWIAKQPDPRPNRQDVIRHAVEMRMLREGALLRPLTHPEWADMELDDDA